MNEVASNTTGATLVPVELPDWDALIPLRDAAKYYSGGDAVEEERILGRLRKAATAQDDQPARLHTERHGTRHRTTLRDVERFLNSPTTSIGVPTPIPTPPRALQGAAQIVVTLMSKGGTGKTTTTVNVAACLADRGVRVLVVDADPQGDGTLTNALNIPVDADTVTLATLLKQLIMFQHAQVGTAIESSGYGFDVIPTTAELTAVELAMMAQMRQEYFLARLLRQIEHDYDVILIDAPPSLGCLTQNAIAAAQSVVIPVEPEKLAAQSLGVIMNFIDTARENELNKNVQVRGIVINKTENRAVLHRTYVEAIQRQYGMDVAMTMIPKMNDIRKAQAYGQPVIVHLPHSDATTAYQQLVQELFAEEVTHVTQQTARG